MSTNHPAELTVLIGNLPDQAILSKPQAAALTGLSEDTMLRLHQKGEGPPRVRLSERRVGYQVVAVKKWLEDRSSKHVAT